jgi:hypothetical protein
MGKGGKREGAGRKKGSKDKISRDLKQLVLDTAAKLEKEDKSLYDCAKDDPNWFYANFVKPMLPKEVNADLSGDINVILKRYSEESE